MVPKTEAPAAEGTGRAQDQSDSRRDCNAPQRGAHDIQRIGKAALHAAPRLVEDWLHAGTWRGVEYVAGDLQGNPGESLSINTQTGQWCDFAESDSRGGDLVSLLAAIRGYTGEHPQLEAAKELAHQLGIDPPGAGGSSNTEAKTSGPGKKDKPEPIHPVPRGAGDPPDTFHRKTKAGEWESIQVTKRWEYRDTEGTLLGYVCRFDLGDGGKEVIPQCWANHPKHGERWCWVSFARPRPLYGLDRLAANPGAHVLLVEGEKAADAAQRLLSGRGVVALSWPGGGKAINMVDWTPLRGRKVALWPDADVPGRKTMDGHQDERGRNHKGVADLVGKVAQDLRVVDPPASVGEGWDAADAEAEGWTADDVLGHVRQNLRQPAPVKPPAVPPATSDEQPLDNEPLQVDMQAPASIARQIVRAYYTGPGGLRRLHFWQGDWREQPATGAPGFRELSTDDMRSRCYHVLERAIDLNLEPIKPNARKVSDVLDALRGVANLDDDTEPPQWLDGRPEPPPSELVPMRNGLLHLPTRELMDPTPALFTLNGLPFNFDPSAPEPEAWLDFLDSIWPNDSDSVRALRQWFGYLLTADTSMQKILMIVGPTRSGKGTIGRVLRELIGRANVAAPTLQSLGQQFGLANLIGKQAAIVSDARLSGKSDVTTIGERLLSISGEDALSIPRKYRQDFTAQLGTRFVILTNELPAIADASGALADRFIVLPMTRSFLGEEDRSLAPRLMAELPGILNWAIDGWQDLQRTGYLMQPDSARDHVEELADMASPVGAFIREECSLGGQLQVSCDDLFKAWRAWCDRKGREHPGTEQSFGKQLRAARPNIQVARPRNGGQRLRVYQGIALLR